MSDFGLANITMFFVITGISLIFVITWIIKSEARVNVCKDEIKKLKIDLDNSERERFVLAEKTENKDTSDLENRLNEALGKNDSLKEENAKLKKELDGAKASLEEVYKALS